MSDNLGRDRRDRVWEELDTLAVASAYHLQAVRVACPNIFPHEIKSDGRASISQYELSTRKPCWHSGTSRPCTQLLTWCGALSRTARLFVSQALVNLRGYSWLNMCSVW